jgi:hypothetical protein
MLRENADSTGTGEKMIASGASERRVYIKEKRAGPLFGPAPFTRFYTVTV